MQKTWLNLDFLHKSFQELFAAFFICAQIQRKEIRPDELVSDPRYFVKLEEILFLRNFSHEMQWNSRGSCNEFNKWSQRKWKQQFKSCIGGY